MSPLLQTFGNATARGYGFTRGSAAGGNALELISTQLISTGTSTVTFSSIPQTYKHLQLRITAGNSVGGTNFTNLQMRVNSTTSGYWSHLLLGSGSAVASAAYNDVSVFIGVNSNGGGSSIFAANIIDLLDYTNSAKAFTVRGISGTANTSARVMLASGSATAAAAAVTSLTFGDWAGGSSFVAGSRFSLYGVKG